MPDLLAAGCSTAETGGRGAGIVLVERDTASGRLGPVVAELTAASPTHLAPAGRRPGSGAALLHAAHELDDGAVSTGDPVAGGHPCHVAVHPSGELLVVSCYGGAVGVVAVRGGVVDELVQVLRVHAVLQRGGAPVRLSPEPVQVVRTPAGAGPRTALVRGGRLHVTAELDATLRTAAVADGRVGPVTAGPATAGSGVRGGVGGWPSEVTPFGAHLLVATRGDRDVLTLHEVRGDGARAVADLPLAGDGLGHPEARHPRHVVGVGRHVYVSGRDSDRVLHLEPADPDDAGGGLRVVGHSSCRTGTPTVVVPLGPAR